RDMMKAMRGVARHPYRPCCIEQHLRPHDVRLDEFRGPMYRSIDVGLGCEMHDRIDLLLFQEVVYEIVFANIAMHEADAVGCTQGFDVREVARIRERIEHDDAIFGVHATPVMSEVGADESRAAGDEQSALHDVQVFLFLRSCMVSRSPSSHGLARMPSAASVAPMASTL